MSSNQVDSNQQSDVFDAIVSFIASGKLRRWSDYDGGQFARNVQEQFELLIQGKFGFDKAVEVLDLYKRGRLPQAASSEVSTLYEEAEQGIRERYKKEGAEFLDRLEKVIRSAFWRGGLDRIDALVDRLNARLTAAGCADGLGGAVLEQKSDGTLGALGIAFASLRTGDPFYTHWISLSEE